VWALVDIGYKSFYSNPSNLEFFIRQLLLSFNEVNVDWEVKTSKPSEFIERKTYVLRVF